MEVFNKLTEFLYNNFDKIFSYIVGIIGIISAIWSHNSAKQSKQYEYLLKIADMHIDKELSDSQIAEAREQIQKMHDDIKKNLPIEARKVVLENEYQMQLEQFHLQYENLQRLKAELERFPNSGQFNTELESIVIAETKPFKYQSKTSLMLTCVLFIMVLDIVPYVIRWPVIMGAIYVFSKELIGFLPYESTKRKSLIQNFTSKCLFITLLTYILIMWFYMLSDNSNHFVTIFNYQVPATILFSVCSFLPCLALVLVELSLMKKRAIACLLSSVFISVLSLGVFMWYDSLSKAHILGEIENFQSISIVVVAFEVITQIPFLYKLVKSRKIEK